MACFSVQSPAVRRRGTTRRQSGKWWSSSGTGGSPFIRHHQGQRVVYLELGVGYNTPSIIKYPFWRMTAQNPKAAYASINMGRAICPDEIVSRAICISGDIGSCLDKLCALQTAQGA